MRKFTKSLMVLGLLLVAGVASAKETVVFSMDYSTQSSVPFWFAAPEGSSVTLDGGLLVINNTKKQTNNWDLQIDLAEAFPAAAGLDYKVNIVYKTTKSGSVSLGMGTSRGDLQYADRATWYGAGVTAADDFQTLTWNISPYKNTNEINHVIWQCGDLIATTYIKSIEVIEIFSDVPETSTKINWLDNSLTNADFSGDDFSCFRVKEDKGEIKNPTIITDGGVKVIKVTKTETRVPKMDGEVQAKNQWGQLEWEAGSESWNSQFWIQSPAILPIGTKFLLKFDYKADAAGKASTQAHATASDYIWYDCSVGDINFGTTWKSFEKEITVTADMGNQSGHNDQFQSIAFNLNEDKDPNVYYFKNISIQLPEYVSAVGFTVGSVGWASYSSDKDVSLGSVKGYAAKYNGSYVELKEVTEVPANNAVLIEGAGKHSFEVIPSAAAIADNDLKVSDGTVVSDGTHFALAKNGEGEVGFMKVQSGLTIPKGKAYLNITTASAREFIGFDEEVSGIEEVNQNVKTDKQYYNLAGQPVDNPTNGIYIVDGKKVIINK
jgi:hypothetical protein